MVLEQFDDLLVKILLLAAIISFVSIVVDVEIENLFPDVVALAAAAAHLFQFLCNLFASTVPGNKRGFSPASH